MLNYSEDLKQFYNQESEKFSLTRKKHWSEFDIILGEINKLNKSNIKILDLGCGDGRLKGFLDKNIKKFEYIGVDFSKNLIEIAKNNNKDGTFYESDMILFLETLDQQSIDIVIGISSLHHLNYKKINLAIKNIYRILNYGGILILINWSLSKYFIKKYYKNLILSIFRNIYSFGKYKIFDIFVPWKNNGKIFYRFVHLYFLNELKNIFFDSGFVIKNSGYSSTNGKIIQNRRNSRNSLVVGVKDIKN